MTPNNYCFSQSGDGWSMARCHQVSCWLQAGLGSHVVLLFTQYDQLLVDGPSTSCNKRPAVFQRHSLDVTLVELNGRVLLAD